MIQLKTFVLLIFATVSVVSAQVQAADFFLRCDGELTYGHTREIRQVNFAMSVPYDAQNNELYLETTIQYDLRLSNSDPMLDNTPGIDYTKSAQTWTRKFDGTNLSFSYNYPGHPEQVKTLTIDTKAMRGHLSVPADRHNPAKEFALVCVAQQ